MKKKLRGAYIAYPGEKNHRGLKKKIEAQIKSMVNKGIDVEYIEPRLKSNFSIIQKLLRRLPFTNINPLDFSEISFEGYDVVYIRYFLADRLFLNLLKRIKQLNPSGKIIIEFFDWPYDRHFYGLQLFPLLYKDRMVRKKYKKYVNKVVSYTRDDEILGIETLHTLNRVNGVVVNDIQKRKLIENNIIDLIAVSIMKDYHGYDRLIRGLGRYYANGGSREIILHMVGDGPERLNYERLAKRFGIEDKVIFYGLKYGQELDDIYNIADVAVASLGLYKLNINEGSFIKTSEYLAKGLPVITGCKIGVFQDEDFKYYHEYPSNDSDIDISSFLEFYDSIYPTKESYKLVASKIRVFSEEKCDVEAVMEPIINYLQN